MNYNAQITSRIKDLCKSNNITINHLIDECKLTKSFIYDIEKRNICPSAERIVRIADYFDVSTDYILCRTDNPEINK